MKPYKYDTIFWKKEWDHPGKPPQGLVTHYMWKSHADYHYAIIYIHQNEKSLKQEHFLTSMLKGSNNSHSEINKIKA